MMMQFIFLAVLLEVDAQEVATPSSLLGPRHYNHHAFEFEQYFNTLTKPAPTKQGPVLFPNDGSPPPRTPLIVTSRPLIQSIARSKLNPNPVNNSISEQSQINTVTFTPSYLSRVTQYNPISYNIPSAADVESNIGYTPAPLTSGPGFRRQDNVFDRLPYTDVLKSRTNHVVVDNRYPGYEVKERGYNSNRIIDEGNNSDDNQAQNYAFSYTVKDQKTGDDFSHSQQSSGSATNGEYRVRLPDGRTQIVSYTADENGYKADVTYDTDSTAIGDDYYNSGPKQDTIERFDFIPKPTYNVAEQKDNANNKFLLDFQAPTKEVNGDKEYYNDYSLEYGLKNYDPHVSKFAALVADKETEVNNFDVKNPLNFNEDYIAPNAKSNYVDFKNSLPKPQPIIHPLSYSVPNLESTTENYVLIGGRNRYTNNIGNSPPVSDFNNLLSPSPQSYLVSTIASLRDRVKLPKPVLSDSFLRRINKYLSFK